MRPSGGKTEGGSGRATDEAREGGRLSRREEAADGPPEGRRAAGLRPVGSPAAQTAQVLRFLGWLTPVVLGFALLEGAAFLAYRDSGTAVAGAVLLACGVALLAAFALLRRGRLRAAVGIACWGFLAGTLIVGVANPTLTPAFLLSPLLAVGLALPYAGERLLRAMVAGAWVVVVSVVLLGEIFPRASTVPDWYASFFRVSSSAMGITVVLLLLVQFRNRLLGTLEQTRSAEERLQHEAAHDALTGLPNRALLAERLWRTMARAEKDEGYAYAVLFLDLDRFKNINDSLGHVVGDELLRGIARRLEGSVHPTDTVARLGGDEFVVLLEEMADPGDAEGVAERVQEALKAPFKLHGHELYATASIGVVVRPEGYDGPEELLRDADTAMYRAKEAGKARHAVFDAKMRQKAVSLLRLETDLRRAVERGEFVVFYQPIVWLKSGGVVGFEALVRWQHPERGLLPPDAFVPLAEETGLIREIDRFVLGEACRQAALWRGRFPDHRPLGVAVNLSAAQIASPTLPLGVAAVLEETGLPGRDLSIEVTESTFARDEEAAASALGRLKGLGVRVHIDDFGTGYSSLALLHRLPVDALKIDRSFVRRMGEDGENTEIVRTILTLAHQLGMDVVAEGIEGQEQLGYLRAMDCDRGQGYRFSKPVPGEVAEAILAAGPTW